MRVLTSALSFSVRSELQFVPGPRAPDPGSVIVVRLASLAS